MYLVLTLHVHRVIEAMQREILGCQRLALYLVADFVDWIRLTHGFPCFDCHLLHRHPICGNVDGTQV